MENLSILVADDHPFFRQGVLNTLRAIGPSFELTEACDGQEALELLHNKPVHILFLDLEMPRMNGMQTLQHVKRDFPQVQVIVLSMSAEDHHIIGLYRNKVNGYLLKNTGAAELRRCIEMVQHGEPYYSPDIAFRLYQLLGRDEDERIPEVPEMNARELAVLKDICNQYSNEEIARRMDISVSSIKLVRMTLYEKTGCKTAAGLAVFAMQHGLYKPERV